MSYSFPPDLEQLVQQCVATGRYASQDELLRQALETLRFEEEDDLQAVEEAIDDLDRGEPGLPLDEAFDAVRRRHGLPLRQ